jgi:glutamate synthase domain-containing protein 2
MSFGALSANAIRSLNITSPTYHRENGGDIIWEIGSGYFSCRNPDGTFCAEKFEEGAQRDQVKMVELKLSQGAKPGHGGVLPAAKVSPEIAFFVSRPGNALRLEWRDQDGQYET